DVGKAHVFAVRYAGKGAAKGGVRRCAQARASFRRRSNRMAARTSNMMMPASIKNRPSQSAFCKRGAVDALFRPSKAAEHGLVPYIGSSERMSHGIAGRREVAGSLVRHQQERRQVRAFAVAMARLGDRRRR